MELVTMTIPAVVHSVVRRRYCYVCYPDGGRARPRECASRHTADPALTASLTLDTISYTAKQALLRVKMDSDEERRIGDNRLRQEAERQLFGFLDTPTREANEEAWQDWRADETERRRYGAYDPDWLSDSPPQPHVTIASKVAWLQPDGPRYWRRRESDSKTIYGFAPMAGGYPWQLDPIQPYILMAHAFTDVHPDHADQLRRIVDEWPVHRPYRFAVDAQPELVRVMAQGF